MYQVSLKSEGVRPFFVITWPGITHNVCAQFPLSAAGCQGWHIVCVPIKCLLMRFYCIVTNEEDHRSVVETFGEKRQVLS